MNTYWAELNENNTVTRVLVGQHNKDEARQWLDDNIGGNWVETSPDGLFRFNYASPEFSYDEDRDAFIPPKPFDSWILNESTCLWEAPIPMPGDNQRYSWNEKNLSWDVVSEV